MTQTPTRKARTLLDHGSYTNLIRRDTAIKCGLTIHRLDEPLITGNAINPDEKQEFVHDEYVIIQVSSQNGAWTSLDFIAVVTDSLVVPLLCGIPFLKHNKIIVDHELGTAIDKKTGFDLLNNDPKQDSCPDRRKPCLGRARQSKVTRRDILDDRYDKLQNNWVRYPSLCPKVKHTGQFEPITKKLNTVAAIAQAINRLTEQERLAKIEQNLKDEYKSIFEPIPHSSLLPDTVTARIRLKDEYKKISTRNYSCPRKYREAFKMLIDERVKSGFIRESDSAYASPSFIIPKKDPTALPRWVCDYRQLNENTVPDNFTLPRVDDILADCGKGNVWAVFDMTDSFFQTRMHPDDIHKTAVTTPFGNYEWLVLPMGYRNAPSIHQRRVATALAPLIGRICHVYMDDIIIWSQNEEEHAENCRKVMDLLEKAKLYLNKKKTRLFCSEVKFLGHKISQAGIEADNDKVEKILEWPRPKSATDVRRFLGLTRYIAAFLPHLAVHTRVLNTLTTKECDKQFPAWNDEYERAFQGVKDIVVSRECLTVIDYDKLDENKIFITTDASDTTSGAVLSYGKSWELARPVAFDSAPFHDAELRYPVHEKELLAIMRALRKWKTDVLGVPVYVMTDHRTLLNFNTQRNLSRRQTRWMEELSIYDTNFVYIKGADNSVADALSRYPFPVTTSVDEAIEYAQEAFPLNDDHVVAELDTDLLADPYASVCALVDCVDQEERPALHVELSADEEFMMSIKTGYETDPWCKKLISAARGMPYLKQRSGYWFLNDRLIVPRVDNIREHLYKLAHDNFGHFGFTKTYALIRESYFWPGMRKDLESSYVPSCAECQRNKSTTKTASGPLHPIQSPDDRLASIGIDFVGPLPEDDGYNCIATVSCRLGADYRFIPCTTSITAEEFAVLWIDEWYCENGMPRETFMDRDKLWVSKFWQHVMLLTGVSCKMSSAYHPQTDGISEVTNKTMIQSLRFHVERNQKGWCRALPRVRFHMMSTLNKSTGYSGFQLRMGMNPRVMPPLVPADVPESQQEVDARAVIQQVHDDVQSAKDNLMVAKISQAFHANANRADDPPYAVGDEVLVSTLNRRKEYLHSGSPDEKRAAKLVPRFDGPFKVTKVHSEASTVTVQLPTGSKTFPTFHTSLVKPFQPNDNDIFPGRANSPPNPVVVDGEVEHFVERIIDHKKIPGGFKYLIRWQGESPASDEWIHHAFLEDNSCVDDYWESVTE